MLMHIKKNISQTNGKLSGCSTLLYESKLGEKKRISEKIKEVWDSNQKKDI